MEFMENFLVEIRIEIPLRGSRSTELYKQLGSRTLTSLLTFILTLLRFFKYISPSVIFSPYNSCICHNHGNTVNHNGFPLSEAV